MRGSRAWVGTVGEGLWWSEDLEGWERAPDVPADARVFALAAGPDALYAGAPGVVYRRRAGGWRALPLPDPALELWSLAVDPEVPGRLWAGCRPLALLASEDGGERWRALPLGLDEGTPRPHTPRVTAILPEPAALRCGVEVGGVFASEDGGKHWTAVNDGLVSLDVHALVRARDGALVAATPRGIARRDRAWATAHLEAPWTYCRALAALGDGSLLCGLGDGPPGTRGAVVRSEDDGRTWRSTLFPGLAASSVWALARAADGRALAAAIRGELFTSEDDGRTWTRLPRTFTEIRTVGFDEEVA
jgi:photosystem II stability/assembly factor-like uncharacterized protein